MPGIMVEESNPPNAHVPILPTITHHATAPMLPTMTHHPPPPRSKVGRDFVRKFCRICGPICIILSICMAIYFLQVTLITVVANSKSMTQNTFNQLWSVYKGLLISLIVLGCITLVVFVLGLLTDCSCLLFLYSFHHFASNLTILMGIVALFLPSPDGLTIAMTVFFFLAFFFFTNYTHWQVLKLAKIMRTGPATITVSYNPMNGPPILYSLPQDGTAIPPPYPGAPSIPFEHPQAYDDEPPKYDKENVKRMFLPINLNASLLDKSDREAVRDRVLILAHILKNSDDFNDVYLKKYLSNEEKKEQYLLRKKRRQNSKSR